MVNDAIIRIQMENENRIIKVKKDCEFTQVSNKVLRSDKYSAKAKGLYCLILSLPSDWKLRKSTLSEYFKDGKDSINSAFNELVEAGFIVSVHKKDEKGRFAGIDYYFFEEPEDSEGFGNDTANGKSTCGKADSTNKEYTNKDILLHDSLRSSCNEQEAQEVPLPVHPNEQDTHTDNSENKNNINNLSQDILEIPSQTNEKAHSEVENKILSNLSSDSILCNSNPNLDKSIDLKNIGLVKASEYVADGKKPVKAKKTKTPKTETPVQRIKKYYLENRKTLYELGRVASPLTSTNNQIINKRFSDLFKAGVSEDDFKSCFDFAMRLDFHIDVLGYDLQKLLSENVFYKLLNNPERVQKKIVQQMKNIKTIKTCPKCGEELNGFGRCSFCDE